MDILVLFSCNLAINVSGNMNSDKADMNTRIDLYHDKYITNNIYQEHKLHCDSLWEKNQNEQN
jgi:hypothetical protein